ncbi:MULTISPECIES: DUF1827 family protein [Amylolactobacillus]|uniref:DUF1827 domain-containing protein n=3 Tax=Amylolactobacillus TaxID=2767876 RepID=A0A1L6XD44_9LACO|nr:MULTISPECIES: DUF1827 family protein [Amylolactobacillus]APT18903.1 hypothetical protein LA20533_06420 [Amylolactobacillus amylophilus DSM 20533 = JCM 1125]GED80064.1 hypothetical protein LAM01_05370 [Amylolactobacillus amylophilus]
MHLIDVTNSYRRMVENQLAATDANLIKVYSLGNTTVIYSEARRHIDAVISNKVRKIKQMEVDFVIDNLFEKEIRPKLEINETERHRVIDITLRRETA